jgi:hypothetical protein
MISLTLFRRHRARPRHKPTYHQPQLALRANSDLRALGPQIKGRLMCITMLGARALHSQ